MCYHMIMVKNYDKPVSCGRCIGCRIDKLSLWSQRALSESVKGRNAFVTFTYDNLHLPYMSDKAIMPTLKRDDLYKYLDNIRHKVNGLDVMPYRCRRDYKYYTCGEYGDKFSRPHYHTLFFGLDFKDFSKFFCDTWHNGAVHCDSVTKSSIRYVLDYMTKSIIGDYAVSQYYATDREYPFKSSSKGFGADFFKAHKDEINLKGCIVLAGRYVSVPTYYRNLYSKYDDVSVDSRNYYKSLRNAQLLREIKQLGFDNKQDYDIYTKIVSNQLQISRYRDSGKSVSYDDLIYDYFKVNNLLDNLI